MSGVLARVLPTSLRDLPPETHVLSLVAFCVALGFGIVAPAIPLFALQFHVGTTAAGAVVSAFALMRFVSGIAAGRVVDRLGERAALGIGVGVVAVSSAVAGLAITYLQLLLLRGAGGVGSAVFSVASTSLLLRVARPDQRGRSQSLYRGGFLVGGIVGPAFGGVVVGISLRAPFFLYAGTLALAALSALLLPRRERASRETEPAEDPAPGGEPEAVTPGTARTSTHTPLAEALRSPSYRAALVANFAVGLSVLGVRSTVVPLLVVRSLGLAEGWVGAAFLVSALVETLLLLPAGRAVDTVGRRPALVTGGLVTALALAVLPLGGGVAGLLGAMAVFGAGSALLGIAPAAIVGDVLGTARGGTAVAVWQMASDLGAIVGPLLAGALVQVTGYATALEVSAAVVGVAGLLGLTVPRRPTAR